MPVSDPYRLKLRDRQDSEKIAARILYNEALIESGSNARVAVQSPYLKPAIYGSVSFVAVVIGGIVWATAKPGVTMHSIATPLFVLSGGLLLCVFATVSLIWFPAVSKEPMHFGWDHSAVFAEDDRVLTRWRFDRMQRWCETERTVAFQTGRMSYGSLPKAALSEAMLAELRATMLEKVGQPAGQVHDAC